MGEPALHLVSFYNRVTDVKGCHQFLDIDATEDAISVYLIPQVAQQLLIQWLAEFR